MSKRARLRHDERPVPEVPLVLEPETQGTGDRVIWNEKEAGERVVGLGNFGRIGASARGREGEDHARADRGVKLTSKVIWEAEGSVPRVERRSSVGWIDQRDGGAA